MVTEEWLEAINKEFRQQDISPKGRPWLAIQKYSEQFNCAVAFSSPEAEKIFAWFEENSQPGVHRIGSLFTGIFYYDACFWPVSILIGFGTVKLNAPDSLESMPDNLKNDLMSDRNSAWSYILCWADCFDYGYGFDDLTKIGGRDPNGMRLLKSGNDELNAAISQLCELRPNTKSMMSSRMAVEMFLKAMIALKEGLTEQGARKIGHNLHAAIDKCISLTDDDGLKTIKNDLDVFPSIDDRYSGAERPPQELWKAYAVAQFIAVTVIRTFTVRDIRPQILTKQPLT